MQIDISDIVNGKVGSLRFDKEAVIPEELLTNTEIKKLKNVKVKGEVIDASEYGLDISMNIKGTMVLECSISLEDTDYDFETNVNEQIEEKNDKNNPNILDITDLIWENIMLEIPLKVVNENAKIKSEGDGWQLEDENEEKIDPRLEELKSLYKEED